MRNHLTLYRKTLSCKALFTITVSLLLFSCSLDSVVVDPDTLGDYFVFCTLAPSFEKQELLLGKTVPENLPVAITDASVIISDDTHSVIFSHTGSGIYRDVNRLLKIQAGNHYRLNITLDNGKIISGETVIPDNFNILVPSVGDTINHFLTSKLDTSSLCHVCWTESIGAKYYTVYLEINDKNITSTFINTFRQTALIPELLPKLSMSDSLKGEEIIPAKLYVFARDSTFNFFPNKRVFLDFFTDFTEKELAEWYNSYPWRFNEKRTNLKGAIGAFSGISSANTEIYLKVKMDWP